MVSVNTQPGGFGAGLSRGLTAGFETASKSRARQDATRLTEAGQAQDLRKSNIVQAQNMLKGIGDALTKLGTATTAGAPVNPGRGQSLVTNFVRLSNNLAQLTGQALPPGAAEAQAQALLTAPTPEDLRVQKGLDIGSEAGATAEAAVTNLPATSLVAEETAAATAAGGRAGAPPLPVVVNTRSPVGDQVTSLVNPLAPGERIELGRGPVRQTNVEEIPDVKRKEVSDFQQTEINTLNFVQGAEQLANLIEEGGPAVLSAPGALSRGFDQLRNFATGIAQLSGVDVGTFEDNTSTDTAAARAEGIFAGLENAASLSTDIKSRIVGLAFAAALASGQTGKGVSDKDFDRFVRQLGASAGNPAIFTNTLGTVVEQLVRNLKNTRDVKGRDPAFARLLPEFVDPTAGTRFEQKAPATPPPDPATIVPPPGATLAGFSNGVPIFEKNGETFTMPGGQ